MLRWDVTNARCISGVALQHPGAADVVVLGDHDLFHPAIVAAVDNPLHMRCCRNVPLPVAAAIRQLPHGVGVESDRSHI